MTLEEIEQTIKSLKYYIDQGFETGMMRRCLAAMEEAKAKKERDELIRETEAPRGC